MLLSVVCCLCLPAAASQYECAVRLATEMPTVRGLQRRVSYILSELHVHVRTAGNSESVCITYRTYCTSSTRLEI